MKKSIFKSPVILLFVALAAVIVAIIYFTIPPTILFPPEPCKVLTNQPARCEEIQYKEFKREGTNAQTIRVPYRCNELILDPSDADYEKFKDSVENHCFVQVEVCDCAGAYELWRYAGEGVIDVEKITSELPTRKRGSGVGGLDLNYIVGKENDQNYNLDSISPENKPNNTCPPKKEGVKVGVVDSGVDIDPSSPLAGSSSTWIPGAVDPGCTPSGNPYGLNFLQTTMPRVPKDVNGHGTASNGIIAGLSPNAGDGYGVNLKFINAKFMEQGSGDLFYGLCGIYYCVDQGADVINLSWGFYDKYRPLIVEKALKHAQSKNVIVVAGIGNDGLDLDLVSPDSLRFWPACFADSLDNVISVAAVDNKGNKATFSNWASHNTYLSIYATGVDIQTLALVDYSASADAPSGSPSSWVRQSGTSMATPFVSRTAAVMRGIQSGMSAAQVKAGIISQATLTSAGLRMLNHGNILGETCRGNIVQ